MPEANVSVNTAPLKEVRPDVEFLHWLAHGSLKQNLLRAIRLWVWLQSLYGDEQNRVWLNAPFTYADWRLDQRVEQPINPPQGRKIS